MSFWNRLPRPFFVLAPMEDVTDTVFRQIVASVGKPDVFFTEFTHVDAICHPEAAPKDPDQSWILRSAQNDMLNKGASQRLLFTESERPIVAQIWGTNPGSFAKAAQIIKDLKFDGIDINLGCPVKDIIKQGGCSALIGQNNQVAEIIAATQQAGLPVSVKTRLGIKKIDLSWIEFLLTQNLAALTIHLRTVVEKSLVPAHWDELQNIPKNKTLLIGNGDVKNLEEAREKAEVFDLDGVMIGRGIFDNLALFSGKELSRQEKYQLLIKHIKLYDQTWGSSKRFEPLKKFVKAYINGFPGASEARQKLMSAGSSHELLDMLS